jgi:hypothetical protein
VYVELHKLYKLFGICAAADYLLKDDDVDRYEFLLRLQMMLQIAFIGGDFYVICSTPSL